MPRLALTLAMTVALTAARPARAEAETHDGFYFHADLGLGSLRSKADIPEVSTATPGYRLELSGTGVDFSVSLGGAALPNLIVAAQLWGSSLDRPHRTYSYGGLAYPDEGSLALSALGLQLAYYLMPFNAYFSVTPSVARLTAGRAGTELGPAIRVAVGKEWWLSADWALGVELHLAGARNRDNETGRAPGAAAPLWSTGAIGLSVTASYN